LIGSGEGTIDFFLQQSDGGLPATSNFYLDAGSGVSQIFAVDLNGDQIPDIVTSDGFNLTVILGDGGGTFGPPATYPINDYGPDFTVADLDGERRWR
jgi:FG-GAP-like repeat